MDATGGSQRRAEVGMRAGPVRIVTSRSDFERHWAARGETLAPGAGWQPEPTSWAADDAGERVAPIVAIPHAALAAGLARHAASGAPGIAIDLSTSPPEVVLATRLPAGTFVRVDREGRQRRSDLPEGVREPELRTLFAQLLEPG